jgi:hypothetical protein
LIAGALAGLLRRSRRSLVYAGWALAAAGIGAGLVVARVTAPTGTAAGRQPGWPGLPTALAAVGLLIANLVAGEDARRVLSRHSFSWRQPIAVLAAGAAAAMPVAAAAAWVGRGAAHPLHRSTAAVLPAFVAADAGTGARPRTLVLRPLPDGAIAIAVVRADTPRFGDLDNVAAVPADPALVSAVHGLFAGQSNAAVGVLAQRDIRYLLAPSPSPLVTRALDAATDIEPVASGQGLALWQVRRPTARVSITSGNTVTALPSGAVGARAVLRPGPPGRRLLLAEAASSQWRVTVAGRPLPTLTTGGGLQGFALPESGGRLLLDRAQGSRPRWLWTELGVLVLLLFLAAPPTRRDDDRYLTVDSAEEQVADQPAAGADEPASAAAGSR